MALVNDTRLARYKAVQGNDVALSFEDPLQTKYQYMLVCGP